MLIRVVEMLMPVGHAIYQFLRRAAELMERRCTAAEQKEQQEGKEKKGQTRRTRQDMRPGGVPLRRAEDGVCVVHMIFARAWNSFHRRTTTGRVDDGDKSQVGGRAPWGGESKCGSAARCRQQMISGTPRALVGAPSPCRPVIGRRSSCRTPATPPFFFSTARKFCTLCCDESGLSESAWLWLVVSRLGLGDLRAYRAGFIHT